MADTRFEFLEHTADAKFLAYGKTIEEAFSNAAIATFEIMTETQKIQKKIRKDIDISAKNIESLLYEFIEHLLFLVDTEAFLLRSVDKITIKKTDKGYVLHATIDGDNAKGYEVKTQIKAATYADMFIKETKNNVTIQMVVDI